MKIYGIIYKITNLLTNKVYIDQTNKRKNKQYIVGIRFRNERKKFVVNLSGFKIKHFEYLGEAEQYAVQCHIERGNIV